MRFLLDTNVVSEWVKLSPDIGVATWLAEIDEEAVFLSVMTLGEIRHGIERLQAGARRSRLDTWVTTNLPLRFEGRILGIDEATADVWGRLMALAQDRGRPMAAIDGFIAATACRHGLNLVTRNVKDFEALDIPLLNPWRA